MRWTDKPESARLRLHSSQPSQMGSERHGWQGTGLTLENRERCVRSHNWSNQ